MSAQKSIMQNNLNQENPDQGNPNQKNQKNPNPENPNPENPNQEKTKPDNTIQKAVIPRNTISIPELFFCFFKIGCFTFGGGWAIVAQMEQEFVDKRKLITREELLEMVAVGRSVPGIMITNISLLFGYHVAGIAGGICTIVGIVTPAVIILSIVTVFYNSFKDNYWVHAALTGIRAAVIPIIGASAISLGKQALRTKLAVLIFAVAFALSVFAGVSSIRLVLIAVVVALLWHAAGVLCASK